MKTRALGVLLAIVGVLFFATGANEYSNNTEPDKESWSETERAVTDLALEVSSIEEQRAEERKEARTMMVLGILFLVAGIAIVRVLDKKKSDKSNECCC